MSIDPHRLAPALERTEEAALFLAAIAPGPQVPYMVLASLSFCVVALLRRLKEKRPDAKSGRVQQGGEGQCPSAA